MRAFKAISPVYTWVFVLVRSCVGPPAIAWLARRLVTEADKVPAGIRCSHPSFPPDCLSSNLRFLSCTSFLNAANEVPGSLPRVCPDIHWRTTSCSSLWC